MRFITAFMLIIFTLPNCKAQNLSIQETLNYINNKLKSDSKIELTNNGILSFTLPSYDYYYAGIYSHKHTKEKQRETKSKAYLSIHIADINNIKSWNPQDMVELPSVFGYEFDEWTAYVDCKRNKTYYKSFGDCVTRSVDGLNGVEYETGFHVRTNDGLVSSAIKLKNALNYLVELAKEKGFDIKESDEDPFAQNNFNPKKFEIKSQVESGLINLTVSNGAYFINVNIGGSYKSFILDTGASDVLISKEFETELINKGFLKKEYYISDGLYKIADGSIVNCRRLIIPELTIGGFTLKNVNATVGNGNILLLGKSVLDKFKSWSIDNLNKTLKLTK